MPIAIVGTPNTKDSDAGGATTLVSDAIAMTAGNLVVVTACVLDGAATMTCADNVNGSYTADLGPITNADIGRMYIFSKANIAGGSTTVTVTVSDAFIGAMTVWELSGAATSSPLDATGSNNANAASCT